MSEKENVYVTIIEGDNCYGLDELKVGETVKLVKEPNQFDDESIKVLNDENYQYGFIANSVGSVARGTHSAGYVHNMIKDNATCVIEFIMGSRAIGRLTSGE